MLHVIRSLGNGGAENQLVRLLNNNKLNCTIYVFLLEFRKDVPEEISAKNVILIKSMSRLWLLNLLNLGYQILILRPNVVCAWMYLSCFLISIFKVIGLVRGRVIWNIRNTQLIAGGIDRKTYFLAHCLKYLSSQYCNLIIYNSNASRSSHEKLGYNSELSKVIGNGFDFHNLKVEPNELESTSGQYFVGSLGRFNEYKDYKTLCDAMAQCVSENKNLHFLLAGYGINYKNIELESLLSQSGVSNANYTLLGPIINKQEFFQKIDLFVLHSKSESFPNVLLEAVAYRKLSVATNVGAVSEIIECPDDIIPPESSRLMARRIIEMSSLKREEVEYKVNRNLRNVRNLYDIIGIASEYDALITKEILA